MPILHRQAVAQTKDQNGNIINLPPETALSQLGPMVPVVVSLAQSMTGPLAQQGQTVTPPMQGLALVDTGASTTCIDVDAATALNLPVIDTVLMASASHASSTQPVFPIHVEIPGWGLSFDAPRAFGAALAAQNILLLIGRDILEHCTLFYNGAAGEFTLAV